jgi:hypothetical protein
MHIDEIKVCRQAMYLPKKRVLTTLPILKDPIRKKSSLTFISPFQKDESVTFALTWDKAFELR